MASTAPTSIRKTTLFFYQNVSYGHKAAVVSTKDPM